MKKFIRVKNDEVLPRARGCKKFDNQGVTLIISIGILSLLVIVATYGAINMYLEQKAAVNYSNGVKASYIAEAGIQKTIADIRKQIKEKDYTELTVDIQDTYIENEVEMDLDDHSSCVIQAESEAEKVNINSLTNTDSRAIEILYEEGGLDYDTIAEIIDYRDWDDEATTTLYTSGGWINCEGSEDGAKNLPFTTTTELKLIESIDEDTYDGIKDYVTVHKPIVRGGLLAKYYKGLTGSSPNVKINESRYLGSIIELGPIQEYYPGPMPGTDGLWGGWYETHDADFAGGYLFSRYPGWGDGKLDNFGIIYEGYIDILPEEIGGPVKFLLYGNDGMRLYIDGELVIDKWNDTYTGGWKGVTGLHTFAYAGWHSIRVDFYAFAVDVDQAVELQWKNTEDTFDHPHKCVWADRLGYEVPLDIDYNNAGFYKIISRGILKSEKGKTLAEKEVTTVVRVFGAWSQTTRSEFSASWNGVYDDFSDGEILNVTWLDGCPLDAGGNPNLGTKEDALKLGFWDNFEEDLAYSAVNFVGNNYTSIGNFRDYVSGKNGVEFILFAAEGYETTAEINGYYCYMDSRTSYDLFAEAWERDYTTPSSRKATSWDTGRFYPKHVSFFEGLYLFGGDANTRNYYTSQRDEYGPYYPVARGVSELTLNNQQDAGDTYTTVYTPFLQEKILGVKGIGTHYASYINGAFTGAEGNKEADNAGCMVVSCYDTDKIEWLEDSGNYLAHSDDKSWTYWDDIRIIPAEGYLVSTPFWGDTAVDLGVVSWTESGNGNISVKGRTTLGLGDTNWVNLSNGGALDFDEVENFQYKVILRNSLCDGQTPVFEDITVTYLPYVDVFYWRQ
ncbi:MAG: hypothetical protein ABH836_08605 [Candidatus Omnitrophota bacterium]